MADSTHTLKLIATLDTSDVQRKIDQLNSKQAAIGPQAASRQAAPALAAMIPGSMASGMMTIASIAGIQRQMHQLLSKQMLEFKSSQMSFSIMQSRMMFNQMQMQMGKASKTFDWNKVQTVYHLTDASRKTIDLPRSAYTERPAPPDAPAIQPRIIPRGMRPGFAALPAGQLADPDAGLTPQQLKQMQQMRRQLFKWGAAYAASHLLQSGAQLAGAYGSTRTADILSNLGTIGSTAAMGAGVGMAGGPIGATVGAATGAAMGAGQVWLNAFTSRKMAATAEERAKQAQLAQLAASQQADASLYSSWLGAKQASAVSSMTSTEANAFKAKQQHIADQISEAIESKDYEAGGLAKLMDSYSEAVSLVAAASQRISRLAAERIAKQEAENAAIAREDAIQRAKVAKLAYEVDARNAYIQTAESQLHGMSQQTESERNTRRLAGFIDEGDFFSLKAGRFAYGTKRKGWLAKQQSYLEQAKAAVGLEEQQSFLQKASNAGREASFAASQMQVFQNGMLSMMQSYLSTLKTPSLQATTSMGQYGYGMGERNMNSERVMSIWQEQVQVQKDIKSILQDKSFEATYSE